jgi:hypothetical protein
MGTGVFCNALVKRVAFLQVSKTGMYDNDDKGVYISYVSLTQLVIRENLHRKKSLPSSEHFSKSIVSPAKPNTSPSHSMS